MGWRKPYHYEAEFFVRLNDWLLHQCGASWDNPLTIRYLLESKDIRDLATRYLSLQLRSPRAISYWGRHYMRFVVANSCPPVWGWKDPRNTFTLPIWLDIFPRARVIHVVRHGVDVAQSLVVRQEKLLAQKRMLLDKYAPVYSLRSKKSGFTDTIRGQTLEGALSLWEEYVDRARYYVRRVEVGGREIRYEDFLEAPLEGIAGLAEFSGVSISRTRLGMLAAELDPSRAYAYRKSEDLSRIARLYESSLASRGYSE